MKETVVDIHDGRFESITAGDFDSLAVENADELEAADGDFEFDVGGTATPISLRRCIPIEQVINLVGHFYMHGEFPEGTEREED